MTSKLKIEPVSQRTAGLTGTVYGRSGTGKTAFAATWPKPILLMDIQEGGTDTISDQDQIDVVEVNDWETVESVYWGLKNGDLKYKTIVFDQVSSLQELGRIQTKKDEKKDPDSLMTKKEWGLLSGLMKQTIFDFRELSKQGINVLFIAHERLTESEEGFEDQIDPSIGPRLMPSVAVALNGAVDLIGNTFIRETFHGPEKRRIVEYCLRVGPHAYYTTKIRRPPHYPIPDHLVDPTYDKVVELIRGSAKPPIKTQRRRKVNG